jgi:hypothetical protein
MAFTPDVDLLTAAMDRVLPPIGDLSGAGSMGLAQEVIDRSQSDDRFWAALETILTALPSAKEFSRLSQSARDEELTSVETLYLEAFGFWVDVVYAVYYMQSKVHARLGWHGRPPQPEGNQMPPWDESVLANIRTREPFWKHV